MMLARAVMMSVEAVGLTPTRIANGADHSVTFTFCRRVFSAPNCNKDLTMTLMYAIAGCVRWTFARSRRGRRPGKRNRRSSFPLAMLACAPLVHGPAMAQEPETPAPLVWFAPEAPGLWPDGHTGVVDFIKLFTPSAPWSEAASHIQVFKIANSEFLGNLPGVLTDSQWRQVFADLNRRGIALGMEWGPLTPEGCGVGIEGFDGASALTMANKIKALGGNLKYITMDEPFSGGSLAIDPNACHWTPRQTAVNALRAIGQVRTVFPDVIVGDIEPAPAAEAPTDWVKRYAAWLDAWREVSGAPLPFLHLDVNWSVLWRPDVEAMRHELASRGIPFGIIYNGYWEDITDADWVRDTIAHFTKYETQTGVTPDHVVFETWDRHPTHALPETSRAAMTYEVDSYFRPRTRISLRIEQAQATGALRNRETHEPISGAEVTIGRLALSGPGIVAPYTVTGTVPAGATQALLQIDVNECGLPTPPAPNDMNFYSYRYTDSANTAFQNFASGLNGWGIENDAAATASVQLVSSPAGPSLLFQASATQQVFVNSSAFTVTPGSAFTMTMRARVSPASAGSGCFALIFLFDGTERGDLAPRMTVPIAPAPAIVATAQTDADGRYSVALPARTVAGKFQLQANFAGSNTLWPAFAGVPEDDDSDHEGPDRRAH
jgi:hypothetical protein